MNIDKIIQKLRNQRYYLLKPEALDQLLSKVEVINERDTMLRGLIRILEWKNSILVQEKTNKNEISVRLFSSIEPAEIFVKERIDTYERMWDGCGCKINYYE